ncbi:NAD(P)H-dependent glycerol-3-phosphate dehydrogenase [Actinomyces sp. zg-332]|uniref:NAD(P)H-dependent glycerol-3-phosphate dehydrogenase n=1 Tax=Actinomyces sp. zg-332 TaxID=2708340 RepID=UPI0018E08239|nr:NAD(P)H-dependent glycerol-3-phosphate dehydrogenase [Actinomyces sp. zg-332]QPK94676.1 NAD(P)H-dependent glycerol-3-phosphate dehydrogenase [Actinomyces sp. zg-332]
MSKMNKVCVIGSGSWGSALSIVLAHNGYDVHIYGRSAEQVNEINTNKTNSSYLPGIVFPENVVASNSLSETVKDCELVVLAVPSQQVRGIIEKIAPFTKPEQILVNVAKGLEKETGLRLSQVAKSILPDNPYVLLSGPSHAEEVAKSIPTIVIAACEDMHNAQKVRNFFITDTFKVYLNTDLVGIEISGALKNIIAFGAGIADGIGFGDNTKAALITRGLYEITRLGLAMGAKYSTFNGMGGIGDLIVTCTSKHSRNWQAGYHIGSGKTLEETLAEVKMVVEGITITEVAHEIAKTLQVKMPIVESIYGVIEGHISPKEAAYSLMKRVKEDEFDGIELFSNF